MAKGVSKVRHFGGFVIAGLAAMATDAGMLELLTSGFGLNPYVARPVSIFLAMIVSWGINRWIAFAVEAPPSLAEFGKFALASAASILVNYLVFAAILWTFPWFRPSLAILPASMVSMFVSYAGFRFGAFRPSAPKS
jgi:putative flippase GtrA